MKMTVREWLQQGGGFTSALLAFFEEPTLENLCTLQARQDSKNAVRVNRALCHTIGIGYSGFGYDRDEATVFAMKDEWPLLRDLDAEVTHDEFRKCFRNSP